MKKILALIISLMMFLPAVGMAEEHMDVLDALEAGRRLQTTLTFDAGTLTGDESVDGLIRDVLRALELSWSVQEGEHPQKGLDVYLSETNILTADGTIRDESLFLTSNLLLDDMVELREEDALPLMQRFVDLLADMDVLSAGEARQMKELLEEALAEGLGSPVTVHPEALETLDLSDVQALVESRTVVSDVMVQPRNSDPAVKRVQVTMSGEDMEQLFTMILRECRENAQVMEIINTNLQGMGDMTAEEAFDEFLSESDELSEIFQDDMLVDIYLDENDEPVYITASMILPVEEDSDSGVVTVQGKIGQSGSVTSVENGERVRMDVNYARLSFEDKVTHAVNVMAAAPENTVSMSVNVIDGQDHDEIRFDAGDGEMSMGVYIAMDTQEKDQARSSQTTVNLMVNADDEVIDLGLKVDGNTSCDGVDVKTDAVANLSLNGTDLLSMNISMATGEPEAPLATEGAVRLAELSDEDFQSWFADMAAGLSLWAVTVFQALPASVLMTFLTGM